MFSKKKDIQIAQLQAEIQRLIWICNQKDGEIAYLNDQIGKYREVIQNMEKGVKHGRSINKARKNSNTKSDNDNKGNS